ncbi:MAG: ABC transporter permease, partial [Planctomycetia bacterium]|nr:ABC transporter permease [Planctomycetia bacterium]
MKSMLSDYGMVFVLVGLCAFFGVVTLTEQHPTGRPAARRLAESIEVRFGRRAYALIVVRDAPEDAAFSDELGRVLKQRRVAVVGTVRGEPADVRKAINRLGERGEKVGAFACNQVTSAWGVYDSMKARYPSMAGAVVMKPEGYLWPNFLKADNLMNVANQIAVIAILAVGMTMVIVTGGIDLSVGSLIALSAVVTSRLIRDAAGGEAAGTAGMVLAGLGGIAACAASGLFSGLMVTLFRVPPFIATLGMMLVTSGLAYILSAGQSINQVPDAFIRLGRGADLFGVPNAVVLMLVLYALAHVLMTRMVFGRYVYAVGGNPEAARLSGVPTRRVLLLVYTTCAALAGLGGVVMASQLKSGAPTYGQ